MRIRRAWAHGIVAALVVAAATTPATAAADPPTRITIVAVFDPISYGDNAYVNGQLIGTAEAGQPVALEQSAPPFTEWIPVGQVPADAEGYYSFKLHPTQTMHYRTSSQGVFSERQVKVSVAPRITFSAAPAGRTSIRFSGTFAPALTGQRVAIQQRSVGGSWVTVANARLRDGKTFHGLIRAGRPVELRAFFATAQMSGASKSVRVVPGRR